MLSAPGGEPTTNDALAGSSLLAVFAHPDDESLASGGLLALCAERGVRVSLLCLTRGEHGRGHDSERLGHIRTAELRDAARVLGIRDLEVLDHEDGMLVWADHTGLEADILGAISRFEPDVIVTFDEDGLYWHPDHIAVHERTTSVVEGLGAAGPALLYVSIPAGSMRAIVNGTSSETKRDRPPMHILGVADPDAFGAMAPAPTVVVDVGAFAGRKLAALRCHHTQFEGSALEQIDERDAARLLGTEHYRRAPVGSRGHVFVEALGTPVTVEGGTCDSTS